MKLSAWLEREGVSRAEFGRRIGKSRANAWRIAEGVINSFDRETALAIFRATGGQVTPNDLLLDGITIDPAPPAGGGPGENENAAA